MDKDIAKAWDEHNGKLKEYFRTTLLAEWEGYKGLLEATLKTLFFGEEQYGLPDSERIVEVDFGYYQGTLVFIIGGQGYQPSVEEHWYTWVDYGSCSGCDTLQQILGYEDNDLADEEQTNDLWTLCLHMMQRMKRMSDINEPAT